MFIEVRKSQGTLSKATYGPAILGSNGSLYYRYIYCREKSLDCSLRSRSTLYAGRVFKFALVNEVVNGTVTRRFYHCADCREGRFRKQTSDILAHSLSNYTVPFTYMLCRLIFSATSRPLVTIITHNDVLVERDPDEPLGKLQYVTNR